MLFWKMTSQESMGSSINIYRKNAEAIFKAVNINYTGTITRDIFPEDRKIKKLRYILDKAKRKQWFAPEEKEEHDRIKLLSIKSKIC